MKKEEIVALGVSEDIAKKIADMSSEEMKGFIPKSRFDEVNEAKKNAEALVKERDGQLETLKKSNGDSEAMQNQIAELQKANQEATAKYESKMKQLQIDHAVEKAIAGANGKNAVAIKALLKLEGAELAEDGTIKGLAKQLENLAKAEDSSFLFGSSAPEVKGMKPADNASGLGGNKDISKMNYDELSAYLEANPDVQI